MVLSYLSYESDFLQLGIYRVDSLAIQIAAGNRSVPHLRKNKGDVFNRSGEVRLWRRVNETLTQDARRILYKLKSCRTRIPLLQPRRLR